MDNSYSDSYREAGVDVTAGYKAVELMKKHVARTQTPGVVSGIGGFGGLFQPDLTGMKEPVLVSGTDGVGTKLKLAFMMDKHDTVGIDCVAMCANDVACAGAKPLFFLDYVAVGKNVPERVAQIVAGVAEGCVQAGCALIGGETAEMPGFYPKEEYDLAGFCVGMADKAKLIDGAQMKAGDALIRYDVLILSDEIHADLALFGHRHTVMASVSEEIAARTLTAMAPSKTFNIAGMMNSVIIASNPEILEVYNRELTTLHLDLGNIFGHVTLKAAYRYGAGWLEELTRYLEGNVQFALDYFERELPQIKVLKPEGSFLLWLDFRGTGLSHEACGERLVKIGKVGLNDGLEFGEECIRTISTD